MIAHPHPCHRGTQRRRRHLVALMVLTAVTLAFHCVSLRDGLFLDDHWHRVQLERGGWSLADLIDASTIEPSRFMQTWWQQKPIRWQYPRPFAMLVMKTVHDLTAGSVVAQHAVSVLLHLVNVLMVYALCFRLTRRVFWSAVAGLIFAVYSHAFTAVAWLASQNALLQTALMLAALLCYLSASGLRTAPLEESAFDLRASDRLRLRPYLAALVLWCLAVASRENALAAPAIFASFDLAFGGRRHLWARRWAFVPFIVIGTAWMIWRVLTFDAMPEVYLRRPDGAGYIIWLAVKLLHYVCSAIWNSPMTIGPSGRYNPLSEVPGDCLLMLAIVVTMSVGYYRAAHRARGWWIWPLWILLGVLPVTPVVATPHTGYMLGVGFAIAMVLGPATRGVCRPSQKSQPKAAAVAAGASPAVGRRKRRPSAIVAIGFLIAMAISAPIHRALWTSFPAAERLTIQQFAINGPPPPDAGQTDLFLINLPFVNIYLQPALKARWAGMGPAGSRYHMGPDIKCHVLSYSPDPLRAEQTFRIEQLDEYRFSLAIDGQPYFSRFLGRFLIDGMRFGGRFKTGQIITGDLFDVEIADANEQGVQRLIFSFHQPLNSENYRFYAASRQCPAARILFQPPGASDSPRVDSASSTSVDQVAHAAKRLAAGDASAFDDLVAALSSPDADDRRAAASEIVNHVMPIVEALGGPPAADPPAMRAWWRRHVSDKSLRDIQRGHRELAELRARRQRIFTIMSNAGKIIRSDLYLTGPPFPGPR